MCKIGEYSIEVYTYIVTVFRLPSFPHSRDMVTRKTLGRLRETEVVHQGLYTDIN